MNKINTILIIGLLEQLDSPRYCAAGKASPLLDSIGRPHKMFEFLEKLAEDK